jgi:hypothetical protein
MAFIGTDSMMAPGTRVEVETTFRGNWSAGFEVVGSAGARYRVRRTSDGALLPVDFAPSRVRRAAGSQDEFEPRRKETR